MKWMPLEIGFLGEVRGRKGEGKKEDLARLILTRSSVYSFILFYRIIFNLPAGYGASAVTRKENSYLLCIAACAAANRAIGTRNGEQET